MILNSNIAKMGNIALFLPVIMLTLSSVSTLAQSATGAIKVEVRKSEKGWELLRDGKPFFIKGAGGDASKQKLAQAGGNSVRTWGADNLEPLLDEAQKLGLTVTVGIWLGHEQHGFNYANSDMVAEQYEKTRQYILKYRNHPALLMWALGNEMEGYAKGDNAAIWSAINNLAVLAKKLDPNHPTMTVVAEIGGDRVKNIERLCPDIDIIGINSYGGGVSIPARFKAAGGIKPYILTEYGPAGSWETGKTSWGAPIELTSTEKGASYRATYEKAIVSQSGLCLGSYAFTWGNKQEATATWFGMFLPGGVKLEAVDAMTELWTGHPAADRCPQIKSLKLRGSDQVKSGEVVTASLDSSNPVGTKLDVKWILRRDPDQYNTNGDTQADTAEYPSAIIKAGLQEAEVKLPQDGGNYRLYAYLNNGKGAAVGNIPLHVEGPTAGIVAKGVKLPFVIYAEGTDTYSYVPSGWMGKTDSITLDERSVIQPHSGKTCLKCQFKSPDGFGGIVWQNPSNDWGDKPGGYDLTGAKKLSFWVRGEAGDEKVSFQYGLLGKDKKYHDSSGGKTEDILLSKEWKQVTIDLTGKDLHYIKTPFVWVAAGSGKPITFYLDDIRYE